MADDERRTGGDLVAALSQRVRELQLRVAALEADLASTQKRVQVYEGFDGTIQEAITAALRAAYEIRERADLSGAQILEQARDERRDLLAEIGRLRAERDELAAEIDQRRAEGRRPIAAAPAPAETLAAPPEGQLRVAATEALRGVFKELVEEMRRSTPPSPAVTEPAPAAAEPAPAAERAPGPSVERGAEPAAATASPAPSEPRPERASIDRSVAPAAAAPEPAPPEAGAARRPWTAPDELAARRRAAEEGASRPAESAPAFREMAPREPAPERPAPFERPTTFAPPEREPAQARAGRGPDEGNGGGGVAARVSSQPITDLELVVSPVDSFPQLVELERKIQSLAGVRTIYVRDFRSGVATLAVGLRSPQTTDEFARELGTLQQLRLSVSGSRPNGLDLRIDGRDSSIVGA